MRFNTFLLGFVALCVAGAAAFFSVTGLSKLFAGASLAIILMAGSLETAKLVVASYLHNYWETISKLMKTYLITAVVVLILITSAGIYGFLTAAYQTTADELAILDRQTEVIELKKERFEEQLQDYRQEQQQLSESITNLNEGLANNTIQYTDTLGNVITTTSSATRRALTAQLDDQQEQRTFVRQRIEALTDSVTSLDIQALDLQAGSEVSAEVGPLRYMAEITGLPMADIVNYFALLIVFVFDPLAVTMIIAFNQAWAVDRRRKKKENVEESKERGYKVYNEGDEDEDVSMTYSEEPEENPRKDWKFTVDMSEEEFPDEVNIPSVQVDEDSFVPNTDVTESIDKDMTDEERDSVTRGREEFNISIGGEPAQIDDVRNTTGYGSSISEPTSSEKKK